MVKRALLVLLCLGAFKGRLLSQGGSLYSIGGLGERIGSATPQAAAMGDASIGVPNRSYVNLENPAMQSAIREMVASASFTYTGNLIQGSASSLYVANGRVSSFSIGIPIWKLVVAFGYYPYSSVEHFVSRRSTSELNTTNKESYITLYKGLGGLSKIPIGLSIELFDSPVLGVLRLGGEFSFFLGSSERTIEIISSMTSTFKIESKTVDRLHGNSGSVGVGYSLPFDIFSPGGRISIGAIVNIPVFLNGSRIRVVENSLGEMENVVVNQSGTSIASIPLRFGLGISFENRNLFVASDFVWQDWSGVNYYDDNVEKFATSYKISIGLQYTIDPRIKSNYFLRWAYLIGVFYEKYNMAYEGIPIVSYGIGIGLGIPLGNSLFSKANLTFNYIRRGTLENNLVLENTFKLRVGISIAEKWFHTVGGR